MSDRSKFLFSILFVAVSVFLADRLFDRFIFSMKNPSGWDSFRWFNFEYNYRQLKNHKGRTAEGRDRPVVLIVGSSISQYSMQEKMLAPVIEEQLGYPVDVEFFVHATMMPADLFFYRHRIEKINPDLIVYPLNPADFDIERYIFPWEAPFPNRDLLKNGYSELAKYRYLQIRPPSRILYPGEFALSNAPLGLIERASLLFRSLFTILQFRSEWKDVLEYRMNFLRQPLRSYESYQGKPIPEGLFRFGHSGSCLTFPYSYLNDGNLAFELERNLAETDGFYIDIYAGHPENDFPPVAEWSERIVDMDFTDCKEAMRAGISQPLHRFIPDRAGWQQLNIAPLIEGFVDPLIHIRLSHAFDDVSQQVVEAEHQVVYEGQGIRLSGSFGQNDLLDNDFWNRRPSLDDLRFISFSQEQYIDDFEARLHHDNWQNDNAIAQFNYVRLAKYNTYFHDFSEVGHFRYLRKFVESVDIPVMIINNPESPLTLAEYEWFDWYTGYLEFLKHVSRTSSGQAFSNEFNGADDSFAGSPLQNPLPLYYDFRNKASLQSFIDTHHLNYGGIIEMNEHYARAIVDFFIAKDSIDLSD